MLREAVLAPLLGVGIGLCLRVLGAGGSILAVPLLVTVFGEPARDATTTSLLIVGSLALVGALDCVRMGGVDLRAAAHFGVAGAPGAIVGTVLNRLTPERVLLVLFALLLIVVAGAMLVLREPRGPLAPAPRRWPRVLAVGALVGVLTGFFGVGGGFFAFPALVLLAGVPTRTAVGTSLLVIVFNSGVGFVSHFALGGVEWRLAAGLCGGGIVGMLAGSRLAGRLPAAHIRSGFAALMFVVAVILLLTTSGVLG